MRNLWIVGLVVLAMCGAWAESGATPAAAPPAGVSTDWWTQVQRNIAADEYNVRWQEEIALPEIAGAYQAPNRAHDLRTYFTEAGPRVIRRTVETPEWVWGLELLTIGDCGLQVADAPPIEDLSVDGNRIEYRRGDVVEWYVNTDKGLEQGFTINSNPAGGDHLVVSLAVRGDLKPGMMPDGKTVEFLSSGGVGVIHYGHLKATDATGKDLPSEMIVVREESGIDLQVDTSNAVYPITIDPLATTAAWTAESDQAAANFGLSVSTAGDVNGDGYADVIVGALEYDNGQTNEGRAYVYHGSPSGLGTLPAWTDESDQAEAYFGTSVSTAGDVNGDGYADIIVGASDYDNDQADEGRAYVYYGSVTGLGASPAWTAESDQASSGFGISVSTAGDVNGDKYADVIVGAYGYDNGQTEEGGVFVWYGSSTGLGANGTPANADWTAESNLTNANLGISVSTAGDVNGDGYADVIVGAYTYSNGQQNEGRAYVYLGSVSGLVASPAWTDESNNEYASFGQTVSTAGDVNGDGYDDIIVGAPYYTNDLTHEGRAYVYLGSASGVATSPAWFAEGDQEEANLGQSVSTAGDVNGGGYADVIVGAQGYGSPEWSEGRAFVWYGSSTGLGVNGTPANADWTLESNLGGAYFGRSVSTAGDVNGDGYADVIIGAPSYTNPERSEGRAYVYLGSASGLTGSANWTTESDHAYAYLGWSVSTAGDVNADGYADIIVGAPNYDNGDTTGRVYVYHGSSSGFGGLPAWTIESDQDDANFGWSVATAGDVNGDGYADVIVGAYLFDNGVSDTNEGRTYVYHGSASGLSTTANWRAESNLNDAYFGYSVSTAGDVNGDGYADVIVGAPNYANPETGEGRVFVWYGSAAGLGENGTPANADWTAESDQASAWFGACVSTAGDVTGDGYADVVIGAPMYTNDQTNEGRVFVWLGSSTGLGDSGTPANVDWYAESDQASSGFGMSVSTAGDVNGDGATDIIVGAPNYSNGEASEGRAFVWHGSSTSPVSNGTPGNANWSAESDQASATFGNSVATAGDVNGDGYADVIVGAPNYDNPESAEGRVYVYLGSASGVAATATWTADSSQAGSVFGKSVSTAGDVNGDGYTDVIVGAPLYANGESSEGRAFVYYGAPSGLAASAGWVDQSNQTDSYLGQSVSTAGDVNGDGYADVIVGALQYDNGTYDEGRVYVYLGSASGLSTTAAWMAESDQDSAYLGVSVSTAGDVNGDGYSDIIVGANYFDNPESNEGRVFVWYGSAAGLGSNGTPANADWSAESDQANARLGSSVSTAGDVNGDGYSDIIVGAYMYDNPESNEGRAFVWYGSSEGLGDPGTPANADWSAEGDQTNAIFGCSVSTAGDVNQDGYADVIVGASGYDHGEVDEGQAYVYCGSSAGLGASPAWTAESNQASASFGASVSTAGDVNGDGFSDVIIGARTYDNGETDEGRAYVFHGSSTGLGTSPTWTAESDQAEAYFGWSVSTAGDVNGDGYADVIIGAFLYDNGETDEGRAYVYHGSASGLSSSINWIAEGDQDEAHFGSSVSAAGDVNGDGYSDVIVGASWYDDGQTDEGGAFLYYGNGESGRGLSLDPRQRRSNDAGPIAHLGRCGSAPAARLAALGRTPFGRGKVKLECEAKPLGTPFDGSGTVQTASWTDTGTAGVELNELLASLSAGTVYHWRVRLLYSATTTPYQQKSRWFTMPWNGEAEADFRTPLPPNAPTTPGASPIGLNSLTWTWVDASSDETGFKIYADSGAGMPTTLRATTLAGVQSWDHASLAANTQYAFQVAATNTAGDSAKTSNFTAWTLIEACSGLTFSGIGLDTISVASANVPSNLSAGTSGLQFANTATAQTSGWQQNNTPWTCSSLLANTHYVFTGQSRNGVSVTTSAVMGAKFTLIEAVSALTFSGVTPTEIAVASTNLPSNLWAGTAGLQFANTTASQFSTWKPDNNPWTSTALTPNTQYAFTGQSRNGESIPTTATPGSKYTLAGVPSVGNNVVCDKATGTPYPAGTTFTFTNPAGFGASTHGGNAYKASRFAYVVGLSPTYAFTGSESTVWTGGSLPLTGSVSRSYYIHLQAINEEGARTPATLDYGPFVIDADAPQIVSIVPVNPGDWLTLSGPTNDDNVNFAITFNENIATFNAAAITVTGGGAGVVQTPVDSGDHTTWTVAVVGITGDGDLSITVNAGADVKDVVGNNLAVSGTSNPIVHLDNTAPTVSIGSPVPSYVKDAVTFEVTYADAGGSGIIGAPTLATGQIALNTSAGVSGTVSNVTGANPFTVTVSGIAGNGSLGITVAADAAVDNAGNTSLVSASSAMCTVDNTAPVVTVDTKTTNNVLPLLTGTMTDASGVTGVQVTINGNTYTADLTGSVWSAQIPIGDELMGTPPTTYEVTAVATDRAGNTGTDATTNEIVIDTTAPTTVEGVLRKDASPTRAACVMFRVLFSAAVSPVDADDFTIGASAGLTGTFIISVVQDTVNAKEWVVAVNTGAGDGTLGLDVTDADHTMLDTYGNPVTVPYAGGEAYTIDKTAPTLSIGTPSPAVTRSGPIDYTVTYVGADSITLSSTDVNLIGLPSGTITVTGSGSVTRTVTISDVSGDATAGISIDAGTASDAAGNIAMESGPSMIFTVDNVPPQVLIAGPDVSSTSTGPVYYSVTYVGVAQVTLDVPDIHLVPTDTAAADTITVTGSKGDMTRIVTLSNIHGSGTLAFTIDPATSVDAAGNYDLGCDASQAVTVVAGVSVPAIGGVGLALLMATLGLLGAGTRRRK